MRCRFISALFILFFAKSFSQEKNEKNRRVFFKVDIGTSFGFLNGTKNNNYYRDGYASTKVTPKIGIALNLATSIKLSEYIYVQIGFRYIQHKTEISIKSIDPNINYLAPQYQTTLYQKDNLRFTYFQLPLLLKIGKEKGLYSSVGLSINKLLKTSDKWERTGLYNSGKYPYTIEELSFYGTSTNYMLFDTPFEYGTLVQLGYIFKKNWGIYIVGDLCFSRYKLSADILDVTFTYGPLYRLYDYGISFGASYSF